MKNLIFKLVTLLAVFALVISPSFADQSKQAAYNGAIYNVFFHPIIAYPRLAFDVNHDRLEYIDSWFVTKREFNKIISQLYKNGFILVSPKDLFLEKQDDRGHLIISRKEIFLPAGKKPLILSLDDYNFYANMKAHGTVHRFWLDPQNKLATITDVNRYQAIIRYDQEVPQLLEDFIAKHPDFSFNNARGIFALTGYNGIFGYNTHIPQAQDYSSQLFEAKRVVGKLKQMGWEFGSHSYFHKAIDKQSVSDFEASEIHWKNEIGSIVGSSSYYIFPFGDHWEKDTARLNFLKSLGYKYFFGVGNSQRIRFEDDAIVMYRLPIDGLTLRNRYDCEKFFNTSNVLDDHRPFRIVKHES